jgi:carbonic anhydrase
MDCIRAACCIMLYLCVRTARAWEHATSAEWPKEFPVCGSQTQSPVDLRPTETTAQNSLPLTFTGYDTLLDYTGFAIKNEGYTVLSTWTFDNRSVHVSGGTLPNTFSLYQFHFHWGSNDTLGSEHTVYGTPYPMEAHLVHYNLAYSAYSAATNASDGLVVFGLFVQISDTDNPVFDAITKNFLNIPNDGQDVQYAQTFPINQLLPSNRADYYTYKGSLTTPPCYNSVTWIVFRNPIFISERQVNRYRELLFANAAGSPTNTLLANNFRPTQPLNGRTVYRTSINLASDWSYSAPAAWQNLYPSCGGKQQSPININSAQAVNSTGQTQNLAFTGYSQAATVSITNTGYSIEIQALTHNAFVSGGSLPGVYVLYGIVFHFGISTSSGSEHSVDGQSYPLEIQLLHFNNLYSNSSQASMHPQGLAAISVLVQVQGSSSPDIFNTILSGTPYSGQSVTSGTFSAGSLLPHDTHDYYWYTGSLTKPNCFQPVLWTVFTNPLYISANTMNALRANLFSTSAGTQPPSSLAGLNIRPQQPINSRVVRRVFSSAPPMIEATRQSLLQFALGAAVIVSLRAAFD